MQFFSLFAAFLLLFGTALAVPIVIEFFETGLVPRLPTAVLAMGMYLLSFLSLSCGLILETVTRARRELKRMRYLNIPVTQIRD